MMKSLANAVGAKTARACDSCLKRRARWYCAADDAFLCQSCDGFVHSANPLARRHERVRLKTASHSDSPPHETATAATWHHGFTRKARTPRGKKGLIFHDLVPEISVEDEMESYELEEELICQVPVLDPMVAELFLNDVVEANQEEEEDIADVFFPTDMDLEEFTADVDTLLGHGLDTESYSMEDLGLTNSSEMFKLEEEDWKSKDGTVPCELSFDCVSHKKHEEDVMKNIECIKVKEEEQKNVLMLRLNYDSVISSWRGQAPPWTSGQPPELDIAVSMRENGRENHQYVGGFLQSSKLGDGGREARVSRYREKRRTRLFAKKIRYEVRKLNAEKRPRMKGRFVKRSSLVTANSPLG